MKYPKESSQGEVSPPLYTRKLTKSGSTRYLSVGTILPSDWVNVKVIVLHAGYSNFTLRIEPIK